MVTYPGTALLKYKVDKYFKDKKEDAECNEYFVKFFNDSVTILPFKNKKEVRKCFKGIRIKSITMGRKNNVH